MGSVGVWLVVNMYKLTAAGELWVTVTRKQVRRVRSSGVSAMGGAQGSCPMG